MGETILGRAVVDERSRPDLGRVLGSLVLACCLVAWAAGALAQSEGEAPAPQSEPAEVIEAIGSDEPIAPGEPVDIAEPAESSEAEMSGEPVETIVVTATRSGRSLSSVPVSVSVITQEEAEQAPAKAVDDMLRTVPGINLPAASSLVSHPTAQSVSMRGLGGTRALVLLDGVPLNDGFGGWVNWTKIPYRSIEQVEVVRGGSSSVYGTYAMGGVINVLTLAPEERVVAGEGSYGTQDTGRANLYASEVFGDTGVNLSFDYFGTDGYDTVPKSQRGAVDGPASSEHFNLQAGVDHQFGDDASAFLRTNLFRDDRNLGTPLSDNSRDSVDGALGSSFRWDEVGDFSVSVFGEGQDFENANVRVPPGRNSEVLALTQEIPTWDIGSAAQWTRSFSLWSAQAGAGADFRHIVGENQETVLDVPGVTPGHTEAGGKQQALGVFAELSVFPLDGLEVLGSLRFDYWRNFDAFSRVQTGAETHFCDRSETAVSPRLSVRQAVGEDWALRGAVYRAFRAPTLNELYRGFYAGNTPFRPNPDLDAEVLRIGGELGVDFQRSIVSAAVTGYWNELEDTIYFTTVSPFPNLAFQRRNIAETQSRGVEVEAEVEVTSWLSLLSSYVFTDATIQSFPADPSRVGNYLPDIPRHQLNFGVRLDDPRTLTLELRGRYLRDRYADDQNTQQLGSIFVLDVSVSRRLGEHWELLLVGENLTSDSYLASQTGLVGTLGAPFQIWGGVRFDY